MRDPEATARDLLAQLGHAGVTPIPARDGREHHLFRISLPEGERLLKFPREDGLRDPWDPARPAGERLCAEGWAIGFVQGVPVPPEYVVWGTEPVCSVMGIIPGTTAEIAYERGQLDEDALTAVCLEMGRTLAVIHARKRPEDGGGLPELPGENDNFRLLHLDFHLGNVLVRPAMGGWQVTGVVDWTCARWGPPEADLVEMQVSVFLRNPRARDAFVAGYRKATPRAMDLADVERRAAAEIRRRLEQDPPESEQMRRRWEDWVETR